MNFPKYYLKNSNLPKWIVNFLTKGSGGDVPATPEQIEEITTETIVTLTDDLSITIPDDIEVTMSMDSSGNLIASNHYSNVVFEINNNDLEVIV